MLLTLQLAALTIDGPALADVEQAVGKCDGGAMNKIFTAEPQRRRAAVIGFYTEQQAIVVARRALALRRFEAMSKPVVAVQAPAAAPVSASQSVIAPVAAPAPIAALAPSFDLDAQALSDRQQALDDARMLNGLRENALDMMRQQYLNSCNNGLARAGS